MITHGDKCKTEVKNHAEVFSGTIFFQLVRLCVYSRVELLARNMFLDQVTLSLSLK
jgi:hypothetical protein